MASERPTVGLILNVNAEYTRQAAAGRLKKIAPKNRLEEIPEILKISMPNSTSHRRENA
jgi:hypothetical protein